MRQVLVQPFHAARERVVDDLRADPYLGYILLFAAVLASFWIWHRLPNFATRDERWRLVDPIEGFAALLDEMSYESLKSGVTYWRSYGFTFYTSAIVLVPVAVVVAIVGELEEFAAMGRHFPVSFWTHWLQTPGWIWTVSLLLARLVTVAFAVGSVYLAYRIGTTMRDRATGRLAAVLLSVTWGFLVLAHEVGEDVPALFFFLLAFYLALRYVENGENRTFYLGCVAGGAAAALKLNAGVSAFVLGAAFLTRAWYEDGRLRDRFIRPGFLLVGVAIGTLTILLGFPSIVVGDPADVGARISRGFSNKGEPHGWLVKPSWWWILRGYLHGLGLPLAVAAVGGVVASLGTLRERSRGADGVRFSLLTIGILLVIYGRWSYVRTHHLLLTFPLLVFLVSVMAMRLYDSRPSIARPLMALLLITSGIYAVGGDLAYASQPRDQSTAWIAERAGPNTTVETYVGDPQEVGIPHDVRIFQPTARTMVAQDRRYSPGIQRWMLAVSERCPDYIVLNYHKSLLYLAPDEWGKRAAILDDDDIQEYYSDLLAEDTYAYEIAETFGRRPRFLDGKDRRPTWQRLVRVGIRPRTMQYGDPQDLGVDQYTIVLKQTGECDPEANSPLR